ncbi:MAG TPA: hypothetical protein VFM65_08760 [Flavobacteriaceae bacterium]|nr:hypothetical protein [Flavobacteriaceae bacterium]
MRLLLIIGLFLFSYNAKCQEWYNVKYTFEFTNLKKAKKIKKANFYIIEDAWLIDTQLKYDKKQVTFSYWTRGSASPLIIEYKEYRMIIILGRDKWTCSYSGDNKKIIRARIRNGFFEPKNLNLEKIVPKKSFQGWVRNQDKIQLYPN